MKVLSKTFVLLISLSLFLSGCGEKAPTDNPSALLQQAVYNLFGVSSMRYEISLNFDSSDMTTKNEVSFNLSLNGAVSSVNSVKAGEELTAVVKINDERKGEYRFDATVKSLKDALYFKFLSLPTIPGFPMDGLSLLVGRWWQVDMKQLGDSQVKAEGLDNFGTSYDKLDELGKKKRDLISNSKFFRNMEFNGSEDLNGRKVYKYNMIIDIDGLAEYMQDLAVLDGRKNTNIDAIRKFLVDANLSGAVWIDSLDTVLMKAELNADPANEATFKIEDFQLAFSVSDLNRPFSIEAPSDYKVFDLGAFFGALFGTSAIQAATKAAIEVPVVQGVPAAPTVVPAAP